MTTLEQLAHEFARKYPTPASHPNGGDNSWDQDCGAVMSRMCLAYGKEPTGDVHSAFHVYTRSKIVSFDSSLARPGDFHFWDIAGPTNGHTSLEVFGGGVNTFMGNWRAHPIEGAVGLGFLDVDDYTRLSGARYLGFSRGYADGDVTKFTVPSTVTAAANTSGKPVRTSTQDDGIPGVNFWKLFQLWAREDGYKGPIDGKPGKNTWAAIQRGRKRWDGYRGPADGVPGVETYKALQRAAQHGGYDGPIDGVLGKNSYRGLAKLLNGKFA